MFNSLKNVVKSVDFSKDTNALELHEEGVTSSFISLNDGLGARVGRGDLSVCDVRVWDRESLAKGRKVRKLLG